MIQDIRQSLASYSQAIDVMGRYRLWQFMILPGLISLVLAAVLISLAVVFAGDLGDVIAGWYPWERGKSFVEGLAAFISGLLMVVVSLLLFKYVVMVIIAPFMGMLSERIESKMTGKPMPPTSTAQLIGDIVRGLRIALRNIIRELFFTLLLSLLNFIPIIGSLAAAVSIFLVQFYYAGFGNMDYTLERKRYSVADSVTFVRQHRWLAIGNGSVFVLLLFIPVLGWFLAPALGTASGTFLCLRRMEGLAYQAR
ncbi:MAG: sulfate transporter CysZ [Bacteroidia bacterium]